MLRSRHEYGCSTLAIHHQSAAEPASGDMLPALDAPPPHAPSREHTEYEYTRNGQHVRRALQECLATLEGGEQAALFASGLAATAAVLASQFKPGDHIATAADFCSGASRLFERVYQPRGLTLRQTEDESPAGFARVVDRRTKLVWIETPASPLMQVVDIAAVAEVAHRVGALLVVDNTQATPHVQQPLRLGADLVLHTTTRHLSGQRDVVGGAVVGSKQLLAPMNSYQHAGGGTLSSFDCWLTLRGIETLGVRMRQHSANAAHLATWLTEHPEVDQVYYPGLESHGGHETARRQMRSFGGTIGVRLRGGKDAALQLLAGTQLFCSGENRGGVGSFISSINDGLVQLCVGIEDVDDLEADLEAVLGPSAALTTLRFPLAASTSRVSKAA